jgi:hypothetical protein
MREIPRKKRFAIFLVLTALGYSCFFLSLSHVPLTDAPSHLARAAIMKSLWFDAHSPFLGTFAAKRFFMPYMLPDLELILLVRSLGPRMAYPVWSTLTVLVVALAVSFYARQLLATWWAAGAATLCSWYFATNYLFILGFFSFEWGLAFAFLALGALQAWRRNEGFGWIALYGAACLATYGAHTACFAILMVLAGAIGFLRVLRKEQSWVRFGWELLPFAMLAAYHLILVPAHPEAHVGSMAHTTAILKIGRYFGAIFVRQSYAADFLLLALFAGIIAGTLRTRLVHLRDRWELLTVCGLASVGFVLLPIGFEAGWYVDVRMLPFVFIPLLMLALGIFEDSGPGGRQIAYLMGACALLAVLNLGSLALFLPEQNREVAQYREALRAIPAGHTILPVDTRRADARTRPLFHADSLYAVDRDGYTPYLFSARTGGGPAGYFSDLSTIYRPAQNWYVSGGSPDWVQVAQTYDYVVITKPWDAERIEPGRLDLLFENSVATVFRVRRCTAGALRLSENRARPDCSGR